LLAQPLDGEVGQRLLLELREDGCHVSGARRGVGQVDAADGIDADACRESAERGAEAGHGRHQHVSDAEDVRDLARVRRPRAAERDECVIARVRPLLDGQDPDGVGRVLVADADHRRRRLHRVEPEPVAQPRERLLGERRIELDPPAEEEFRVEPAEQDVRVGDRRLLAALRVAGGARRGAGALRPHLEETARIDPPDRAPAGADRPRRDARHADGEAELELEVGRVERLPVEDEADVAARPAHVERERLADSDRARDRRAADAAAGDPGEEEVRRARASLGCERPAAVRLQERPATGDAGFGERARDPVDVLREERLGEGVDGHGRATLVLAPDRRHLVRERDRHVR
jgi:hypothetical protein